MEQQLLLPETLDSLFPYFVLLYGAMMTFVLNTPKLVEIANKKFPEPLLRQMNNHRFLAIVCLVIGSLWSLQNIWAS